MEQQNSATFLKAAKIFTLLTVSLMAVMWFALLLLRNMGSLETFTEAGLIGFIFHVVLGGICYLTVELALSTFSTTEAKLIRPVFWLVVLLLWWLPFNWGHRQYNGHPQGWSITIGNRYGMLMIWGWCAASLLRGFIRSLPKKRTSQKNLAGS